MNENEQKEKVFFLKGKNVNLRHLNEDDVPVMTHWLNDSEVTQYITINHPMTLEQELEYLKANIGRQDKILLGIETLDGVYIGNISIDKINHVDRTATTGIIIGNKEYWGKGHGTEAKMLLLNYAFNTLNIRKIHSSAISFNERSVKYQKKTGAVVEGVLKDQIYKNGKYYDQIMLSIFKEDWLPIWDKFQKEVLT